MSSLRRRLASGWRSSRGRSSSARGFASFDAGCGASSTGFAGSTGVGSATGSGSSGAGELPAGFCSCSWVSSLACGERKQRISLGATGTYRRVDDTEPKPGRPGHRLRVGAGYRDGWGRAGVGQLLVQRGLLVILGLFLGRCRRVLLDVHRRWLHGWLRWSWLDGLCRGWVDVHPRGLPGRQRRNEFG